MEKYEACGRATHQRTAIRIHTVTSSSHPRPQRLIPDLLREAPSLSRQLLLNWADKVLVS